MADGQGDGGDDDLIARVYPILDRSKYESYDASSLERLVELNRDRLQPLASAEESAEASMPAPAPDAGPCLELRFSRGPRTSYGFIFGSDKTCDIVLPVAKGISPRHCAVTFENDFADSNDYWLVLRDYSTQGTSVKYSNVGGVGNRCRWIIGCPSLPPATEISIALAPRARFRIVVARHDSASPAYIENVNRLLQGTAGPEESLMALCLRTQQPTELATKPLTRGPSKTLVEVEALASNPHAHFSVVKILDVRTGATLAAKEIIQHMEVAGSSTKELIARMERAKALSHVRMPSVSLANHPFMRFRMILIIGLHTRNGLRSMSTSTGNHNNLPPKGLGSSPNSVSMETSPRWPRSAV